MEALGIDIKLLVAQTINFFLFLIIFQKFLYKPFKDYLGREAEKEKQSAQLLHDLQERESSLEKKEEEILAKAKSQVTDMMKEAEKMAGQKKDEILVHAKEESDSMMKKAQTEIENERKKLYEEVKQHVVTTSEHLTEAVLKELLTKSEQEALVSSVIKKLKEKK